MSAHHVVVDGSNIATEGRTAPSLQQLDDAVRAFLAQHPHDVVTVVVDATFGHRIDASERQRYEEAVLAGEIVSPPAGAIGRGDAFVLLIADRADATVLSNDSFQEFHGQYGWLFDEGRLVGGKPVEHVGWVFLPRTPVRGPASRKSIKDAKQGAGTSPAPSRRRAKKAPAKDDADTKAPAKRSRGSRAAAPAPAPTDDTSSEQKSTATDSGRRRKRGGSTEPLNAPMVFIEFIAEHPLGSEVDGVVDRFSSHGAYVTIGDAQCYIPLKAMDDPAPRRARDVLTLGESRTFVVQSFDTPRRGIDLALPGFATAEPEQEEDGVDDAGAAPSPAGDQLASNEPATTTSRTRRTTPVATKKTAAKKAPAKKAPAKAAAKKAPAKKAPAKKAPAKKAPAKKAPAKKAPAKKAPAKKAPAKKAPAKKAPAKKAPAKKAPAKKAPAKKAPAKKAPAKKAPAKKAPAKKAPAKKAPARR
ncbi:histone H1-like repetitive region-containing protein [Actinomarinicola tropica]|uniref:S1 RNA-binding domain-containing protein n=1 Tax=Actinomarinicola tropica TaxID=2789776 RepID=A0A5Q2RLR8_9ACTN|nr:histone H1-like repetitive region-containing protein [Actinomarinicola tropica]QGG94800.1 S1 RNA-binding domain-containing protein [Actinomarinicola tropica]